MTLAHLVEHGGAEEETIARAFGSFASRAAQMGRAVPMMLAAVSTYHMDPAQIVLAGDPASADAQALARGVHGRYLPQAVVIPLAPAHRAALASVLPWTGAMHARDGRATVYVCRRFACDAPAVTVAELDARLNGLAAIQ
jgi:uncharacterized protein YyaL (SSP411 family)